MSGIRDLLKASGYSEKAIGYYLNKVNVGELSDADAHAIYTGPCGDTMEVFLRIEYLGGIPPAKVHCTCLSKRTLQRAIKQYKKKLQSG